jgi:hypothetical protein
MSDLIRRFRGLGVALVVLALSAGAVFAAAPRVTLVSDSTSDPGIEQPDGGAEATEDTDTDADEDADADATEDVDTDEADAETDGDQAEDADGAATDTHGALVSEAAQASLDPRFDNRGEWVSCVAKLDKTVTSATVDWALVTEDCAAAAAAKDAAKDAAKVERDAAKAERAAAKAERAAAKAERAADRGKAPAAKDRTKTHGKHAPKA